MHPVCHNEQQDGAAASPAPLEHSSTASLPICDGSPPALPEAMEEWAPCPPPPPPSGYEDSAQHLLVQASGIAIGEQPSLANSQNSSREETPSGCRASSASQASAKPCIPNVGATILLLGEDLQAPWSARAPEPGDEDDSSWKHSTRAKRSKRSAQRPPTRREIGIPCYSPTSPDLSRRTIILRPRGQYAMRDLPPRQLHSAISNIIGMGQFKYHVLHMAISIAIDVWSHVHATQLLRATQLGDPRFPIQPYEALAQNQVRGVIYSIDPEDTQSDLRQNLICKTHRIVSARRMGAKGNAALITFEGNEIPREVLYYCGVKRVLPYLPKAVNCSRCHKIGHKYDVCPIPERCSACGREKTNDHKYVDARVKCRKCGGSHLGTDPRCPSRLKETLCNQSAIGNPKRRRLAARTPQAVSGW
ncbi:hypothetical protein HPB48_026751 [Haemaphysalis longicornis]|uniref:Uncharacterized protein n=1 Tax=Haemaphysalis longicornis TaxID=44386 RepID=A0A9J6HC94_HAELO|nr:hypothetical protein HPB48_026751 [Haemaphysalis longicornis]